VHPIEIMVTAGALTAPISGVISAIRWKRARQSHPADWRSWSTLVSLLLSLLVAIELSFILIRAAFIDFNAHYHEYLFCLWLMAFTALASVIAAACSHGGGRIWALLTSCLVLAFVLLVSSIPP